MERSLVKTKSFFCPEKSAKKFRCQIKAEKNAYSPGMTMVKEEKNI